MRGLTMLKDTTYKKKFLMLSDVMPAVIETVKKEIKNEHLRNNKTFSSHYFSGKHLLKLTVQELVEGYSLALDSEEHAESVGDFIAQRWIVKKPEIYNFFVAELSKLSSDFTSLSEMDTSKAAEIAKKACEQFDPLDVYLFSVLNAVVFPEAIFDDLKQKALISWQEKQGENQTQSKKNSQEIDVQLTRVIEKYEKKIADLQQKYLHDTEVLKRQVAKLQKQIKHA